MNFSGWVPIRRNILEHTMTGALSGNEFSILMTLILLADKSSGRGTINAPTLRTYLPGLKYDSAKRALSSLEEKGYIWRSITPMSKLVYPYWVNRYEITDGLHAMFQTDLSQVFESKNIKDIRYVKAAPHTALERHLETAPQTALERHPETSLEMPLNNNKDKDKKKDKNKDKNKDNPLTVIESGATASLASDAVREREIASDSVSKIETGSAPSDMVPATALAGDMVPVGPYTLPESQTATALAKPPNGVGLYWSGKDGGFLDSVTHRRASFDEVNNRVGHFGFKLIADGDVYFVQEDTGAFIDWTEVQQLITDNLHEKEAA